MTIEQKFQLASILANANRDTIPAILEIFGLEQRQAPKPPRAKPKREVHGSVKGFLCICGDVDGKVSATVYAAYREYCKGRQLEPLTHIEFSRQVTKALGIRTINKRDGRQVQRRYFKKKG